MFANTLTVTVNAVAKALIRVNQDKYSSEYSLKEATQSFRLLISHQKSSAKRGSTVSPTAAPYELVKPTDRIRVYLQQNIFATASTPQQIYEASVSFPYIEGQDTALTRGLVLALQGLTVSAFLDQLVQGES